LDDMPQAPLPKQVAFWGAAAIQKLLQEQPPCQEMTWQPLTALIDDLTGQTLKRYEIGELIGEGGTAAVYRARQPGLERDVAAKVMLPMLAADPIFRQRFEREAQAIAHLRHPNILTVHDYGQTDDERPYLVVDYVEGGTLCERLDEGGIMPLEEAVEIVAQVAEALDYAHRQGVIHVPNSVDAERFHPSPPNAALRDKLGLDQGYVLGFAGEARAKKGLTLLLKAFGKVATKVDAHLLLIGGLRPKDEEIYQLFRRRNPQLSIHLIPYVSQSELVDYYNLMDLVLMPSLRDGLPNALLEAMACGRTVVASNVGGLSDVIENGQNGFLVPPRNKQAFVDRTLSALADANQRRVLGQAARATILRDYTPKHELNNNLRIYHHLLAEDSPP